MEFFVSGYYLVQASRKDKPWMDKDGLLPAKIWSGSSHICAKYPDAWILKWVSGYGKEDKREEAKKSMDLSAAEFTHAQDKFDELLAQEKFGFPNVYVNRELALESFHQFFRSMPDLKLLGLGLPESRWEEFMTQYDSEGFEPITRNGVYKKLLEREYVSNGHILGYDALGFEGADFCSLLCSGSERDAHYEYGATYNEFGLITEFEPAEQVSEAFSQNKIRLHDGFWCPWLVFELELPSGQ